MNRLATKSSARLAHATRQGATDASGALGYATRPWVLALALVFAATSTAAADPTADEYHNAGLAAYRAGDFAAAASAFQSAYDQAHRAESLFSLAQAYRMLYVANHDDHILLRAVELYRQYLAAVPRGGRSSDARELLANLDPLAELARARKPGIDAQAVAAKTQLLLWSSAPGATAALDGAAPAPLPLVAETTAGEHRAAIAAPGFAADELTVTAVADRLVPIEARLAALPARLVITTERDATIIVDGTRRELATAGIGLTAGTHELWVGARGRRPASRSLVLTGGEQRALAVDLPVSPRRRRAKWLTIAAGAVAAGSAAAFGASLLYAGRASELRDVLADRPWTPMEHATYESDRAAAQNWRMAGVATLVTAALTGAVAAWLFFDDTPEPRDH